MKRIVIGEFKSMRCIERLLAAQESEFGVFVDFNDLELTPFDWTMAEEIIVYLEDLETFTRHHGVIAGHRDRIWLLLARRRVRKYRIAMENEGYRVIDTLGMQPLPTVAQRTDREGGASRCIVLVGDFEPAYRFATMASGLLPCLLVDLDGEHTLAERRLSLPAGEVWHCLSEHLKMHGTAQFTDIEGCRIVPVTRGSTVDPAEMMTWIGRQRRRHGLMVIRLDTGQLELGRLLAGLADETVALCALRYEDLIRADHWLNQVGGGRILGIRGSRSDAGFLAAQSWVAHEILGIIGGSTHPGRMHVKPAMPRHREKDIRRMLDAFGVSRRGS